MSHRQRVASLTLALVLALSVMSGVGSAAGASTAVVPETAAAGTTAANSSMVDRTASTANESTSLNYTGDTLALDAGPGQVVHGETTLPAGTTLGVRLLSSGGSKMFIMSSSATVTKNGTFRTTFDLADIPAGESMNVTVTYNGSVIATADGRVTDCTNDCATPSPSSPSASIDGGDNVSLGAGPGRPISGTTNLPPGATVNITLTEATDSPAFSSNKSVTVGDDDRFRAVFNLSASRVGAPVRVIVEHNGSRLTSVNGTVVACEVECTSPSDPQHEEETTRERNESEYDDLNIVQATQGETARIELTFEPENVTLSIGGPQMSYALNLSVRDGNDDDRVVILFATDRIGRADVVSVANGSDSVSVIDERVDGDRSVLDEGQYYIEQSTGPLTTQPDDKGETFFVERGTLTVSDVSTDESGDESAVEEFGWPEIRQDGEYVRQKVVRVRTDGTVRIPIKTDEMHATTLTIGHPLEPYTLSAIVRDGTGDERVVLVFDATAASENSSRSPLRTADEGDYVNVTFQNGTLVPGEYDTDLYLGSENITGESNDGGSVVFGPGGRMIVAEGNSTPTMASTSDSAALSPSDPVTSLGILGLGGLLGAIGIALLVGLVEL